MQITYNNPLIPLSMYLQVLGSKRHIPEYIVVKDVVMKLLRIKAIQCRRRITINIPLPKEQSVGG